MRAVLAVAVAFLCVACSADARKGRVYRGPSDGAHEGGATDPAGAAAGGGAAPGDAVEMDPSEAEAVVAERKALSDAPARDDPSRRIRRRLDEDEDADAFFGEKVLAARQALDGGADAAAGEIVDGALALNPPTAWLERLKAIKAEVRTRRLEDEVLRVDVRGVREYVTFAEALDLVVRIRNVGTADVVIAPPTGSGKDALSGSTLMLTVRRRDVDVYAAELERTWNRVVPLVESGCESVRIPPEGSLEVRVRIPAEDVGEPISGLRVLEVGGDLRAGRIEAGLPEPLGRVRIRTGRVVVVPGNFEPLAADPLGSMRKAATSVAPVHLLVAAEFLAPRERASACALLADVLATGSPDLETAAVNAVRHIRRAAEGTPLRPLAEPFLREARAHPERAEGVLEGLAALTGVTLAPDPRLWEDWWRRDGAGTDAVVPTGDGAAASGDDRRR
ncbi:MAG: hypothetical protein U1E39_16955 [Planctomycetota bacterium]